MEKLIRKLESCLGYKVEVEFGNKVIIRSGGNRPPEQEYFEKEFSSNAEAGRWIYNKCKEYESQKETIN